MKSPTRPTLETLEDRLVPSMTPAQQAVYDHVEQSRTAAVAALDAQEHTYQGELTAIVAQLENLQEQMSTLDAYDNVLAAVQDLDARIAALPEVTTPQWQTNSRTQLPGIDGIPLKPFVRFDASPDGKQLLAIRDTGSVSVFDTKTGQQIRSFETGMTGATAIEWSPNGQSFVVCGRMGGASKMQVHNVTNGEVLLEKNFGNTSVASVRWSPDGTRVSAVMSTGTSAVYEVATGAETMRTAISSVGTYSSAYSKDGTELYADVHTSSTSGYIAAYDTTTGALKRKYEGITGSVTSLSVSPDGTYLLASGSNGHVYIFNAATGAVVTAVSEGGAGYATSAVWNDAGNAFAVARGLTTPAKTGVTVYTFNNGAVQQVAFKQYPEGTETLKLRFLPGSQKLLIQETTWAYGANFYTSISALNIPDSARPATRDALIQTRDALLNVLPDEKDTTQEIADARDDLLSGMTQLAESLQTTTDNLAEAQAQEAAVDAFFSDYATQIATVLTGSVSIGATELMATAGAAEQADTAVLEAQDALWLALTNGADDAHLAEAADTLAQSLSQRAAAYGSLTPATLASPAPAGVDLLSLAGARGTDALKSALLTGATSLPDAAFKKSIAILSKTTEGPWDAVDLWTQRITGLRSAGRTSEANAAQTTLDQLTSSLTIRERDASTNQTVSRALVRPSERQALLQTLSAQARQTAAEFQQAYRLSGLMSGSRNETGDHGIRFYSAALDINVEIRPNGDVVKDRVLIATLDPIFHSRPELLETLVPNDGLGALADQKGYGLRETYVASILTSQLGAVRMTLGSPNSDHVRQGEFLNAQGVPVARVYVENGTGTVRYMNGSYLSDLSAAVLNDIDAYLATGKTATTFIGSTGILPERGAFVARSTVEQAAAFATQYGLELKGGSVHKNALGQGEESAWSTTLNTWLVWKDGKVMTEQEFLQSIKNPSYAPQVLATFNTGLGGMAFVTGAPERLRDGDLLNSLPAQARMQMNALTTDSGAMLDLRQENGAIIATNTLTNHAWVWDITSSSWRDVSASAADLSASVTVTERSLHWSPTFQRTFAESALSTLGLQIPSVRDFAIRINANLFGRTQDDDLAALRRNAFLFTGQWDGQAFSARYQSLVQSRLDTMQSAEQQYNTEYARLLDAIRAAYHNEEALRAGEQANTNWMSSVPASLASASSIATAVHNHFYRLYQTALDLNQSTSALAAGADRVAIANAYDARIIHQFEDSVRYLVEHPDSVGTPFSKRVSNLIYNTDVGVLQKYFAGTAVVGSTLDTLMPKLHQTFLAMYSTEPNVDQRVAGIWKMTIVTTSAAVENSYLVAALGGTDLKSRPILSQDTGISLTSGEAERSHTVLLKPTEHRTLSFHIDEAGSYLNVALQMSRMLPQSYQPEQQGDMTLSLWKKDGLAPLWSKTRTYGDGLSLSGMLNEALDKGDYEIRISRAAAGTNVIQNLPYSLDVKISKPNRSQINGKISRDNDNKVFSVSLKGFEGTVVNSITSEKKIISKEILANVPTWVVIHGRTDDESSDQILELASTMKKLGQQVITLDWSQAAKDNASAIGLEGSAWIDSVASWAVRQLKELGLSADNINLVGHSWGTYVSNSIAMKLGHVNTLIALDPASDSYITNTLGNEYKTETIDFARYSNHSLAMHSSEFGSANLARTANKTVTLDYPANYEADPNLPSNVVSPLLSYLTDETGDALREHGFAISAFCFMLKYALLHPNSAEATLLPLKTYAATISQADDRYHSDYSVATTPYYDEQEGRWKTASDADSLQLHFGGNGATSSW